MHPTGASGAPQGPWVLPATDLSAPGGNALAPQVAISPDGTIIVVWAGENGGSYVVQAAIRPAGGSFGAPVNLSAPSTESMPTDLAIGPDGAAVAVWQRFEGSDWIAQAATRPAGGSFGPAEDLSTPGGIAGDTHVAIEPDGTATVVWQRWEDSQTAIQAATRPPGGDFGAPVYLTVPVPGHQFNFPQVAAGPGGVAAVWLHTSGASSVVQAATRPPGGAFGSPVDLSAPDQHSGSPQVAVGPDGTTTAVWFRPDDLAYNIIQAATRPPSGSFGPPMNLSAPGQSAVKPQVTTGPDGTTTAIWVRWSGSNNIVQATTRPANGSFGAAVDISAPGQNADDPQVAIGPDGSATAVWRRGSIGNLTIQSASTARPNVTLDVTRSGSGQGKVVSIPAGIDCGSSCGMAYPSYTKVTLTATAAPGSDFAGWSGACTGQTPTCTVTMLAATSVNAAFKLRAAPSICRRANLKLGKFKAIRRNATGILRVRVGAAGRVILRGSRQVRRTAKKLKRRGAIRLRVRAKGRALRQLNRRGRAKVRVRVIFRPAMRGCKAKSKARKVRLVK